MATEVREWAKGHGWPDINERGKLPEGVQEAYDQAAGTDVRTLEVGDTTTVNPDVPGDYPAGMTDDDFAPAPEVEPEARPRDVTVLRPGKGRARPGRRWVGKPKASQGKPAGKGAAPKKRARVPVDRLITNVWTMLAQAARPLPPTARVLTVQAPVAGALLEGTVKNTAVDAFLQPLARFEQGGEIVFALAGPPLMTTAIAMNPAAAPFILPVLRESLMVLMKVGGPAVAEAIARGAADEQKYGPAVDGMLAMIFADLPADQAEAEAQAEAMRAAQATVQGQPA
jgi:hypothetical protein